MSPPLNGETPTSPRAWASVIIKARTRTERNALLSQVPDNFRPIAETHVRNHFARRASDKRSQGSAD